MPSICMFVLANAHTFLLLRLLPFICKMEAVYWGFEPLFFFPFMFYLIFFFHSSCLHKHFHTLLLIISVFILFLLSSCSPYPIHRSTSSSHLVLHLTHSFYLHLNIFSLAHSKHSRNLQNHSVPSSFATSVSF